MNRKQHIFKLLLLISFLLLSARIIAQDSPVVFDLSRINNSVKFSEIFTEIIYIPLETNKNCHLSSPVQIQFSDSLIFIQDRSNDQVYSFKLNGEFVSRVGTIGRGPNEIVQMGDFIIDKSRGRIEVHDRGKGSINIYDYQGKFINSKDLRWAISLGKTPRGNYLLYSGYPIRFVTESQRIMSPIILVDDNDKLLSDFSSEFHAFGPQTLGIMSNNAITIYDDTLIFCPNRSNTIYDFTDNNLRPRYVFDFGSKNLPKRFFKISNPESNEIYAWQKDYVVEVYDFIESEYYCTFHFPLNGESHQAIINKNDFSSRIARRKDYINDLDQIMPMYFNLKGAYNNYLVAYIQALDFKNQVKKIISSSDKLKSTQYTEKHNNVISVYNNLQDTDNPIIILYKVRNP